MPGETFGEFTQALSPFPNAGPCGIPLPAGQYIGEKGGTFGNCATGMFNAVVQWTVTVLVTLVILSAIIITLFRVWFMLLKSFAYIIIYTALGPLYLFAGIFPNSTFGFSPWIRGLISNLMVYPVVIAVMLAGRILMTSSSGKSLGFNPPLIGTPANGVTGLGYLIGFSFLLILPNMLEMVREALKSPANKYIAPAIIGGFKAGAGAAAVLPTKTWGKVFEKNSNGELKGKFAKFLVYGRGDAIHKGGEGASRIGNFVRAPLRWGLGVNDKPARQRGMLDAEIAKMKGDTTGAFTQAQIDAKVSERNHL
jgi:hypothetical protein